ncbi:MAG: CBS domain-containing protein [Planctomycetota bacterium]|jgi:CBS domain-containing protein
MTSAKSNTVDQIAGPEGKVLVIGPHESVMTAAKEMVKNHVGCLLVVTDKSEIMGILSERDVVSKAVVKDLDLEKTQVEKIMTRKIVACTLNTSIPRAQRVMAEHGIRHVPVVENGVPVAMISSRDILAHQLETVRSIARKQSRLLNELEHDHPGITQLETDTSGRIVI